MSPCQALAAIRLNPATLDKFLASACSLADALSPPERDKVLLAAKEARSMGLLIDHLRNLSSHQCSVEQLQKQQMCGGGGNNQKLQHHHHQEMLLLAHQQEMMFLLSQQPQDIQFQQHQQQHLNRNFFYRPLQIQNSSTSTRQNYNDGHSSIVFAHANMQTLFRAARSLASNVARLLYLTDTIDEREATGKLLMGPQLHQPQAAGSHATHAGKLGDANSNLQGRVAIHCLRGANTSEQHVRVPNQELDNAAAGQQYQQQHQHQQHHSQLDFNSHQLQHCGTMRTTTANNDNNNNNSSMCDKFDNAADYSQLLRSFGELSDELVDLGFCCLLAQKRASSEELFFSSNQSQMATKTDAPFQFANVGFAARDNNNNNNNNATTNRNTHANNFIIPDASLHGASYHQHASPMMLYNKSNNGDSAADYQAISGWPSQVGPNCVVRELVHSLAMHNCQIIAQQIQQQHHTNQHQQNSILLLREQYQNAAQFARHKILRNHLHGRIQDLKNLFNVNRLIIDRSILLFLSASKCCLRQGSECLRGLEARISIVGQARASISIVMAIVKLTIFANPLEFCGMLNQLDHNQYEDFIIHNQSQIRTMPSKLQNSTSTPTNYIPNKRSYQNLTDNFFFSSILNQQQQPNSSHENLQTQQREEIYLNPASDFGDFQSEFNQLFINREEWLSQQQADFPMGSEQLDSATSTRLLFQANANADSSRQHFLGSLNKLNRFQRSLRWKSQQIIDFFLLSATDSATISAHDAIDRLQLLMEPFSEANNHKGLTSALNDTFEMFRWLNEHALNDRNEQGPAANAAGRQASDNPRSSSAAAAASGGPASDQDNNNEVINEEDLPFENPLGFLSRDEQQSALGAFGAQQKTATNCATSATLFDDDIQIPSVNREHHQHQQQQQANSTPDAIIMDKRQLIDALTSTFLGKLKNSLVERVQEFTDSAYTKHENRETILQLVQCIKLQLNKLVKLLYRLRRRPANVNDMSLALIHHLATQFDETCIELKLELQNVVIDQSDELDRINLDLDIIKELKQQTLMGDLVKTARACKLFQEQNERLVELCKMLNQVASTNKMKMTTKSLAIWFELNTNQLIASADCLSREPRSQVLKDHLWSYIQVYCSFYDDFCQLARQTAYLVHRQFDGDRAQRIMQLRHQIRLTRNQRSLQLANFSPQFGLPSDHNQSLSSGAGHTSLLDSTSSLILRQGRRLGASLSLSQPIESTGAFGVRPYAPCDRTDSRNANYTANSTSTSTTNNRNFSSNLNESNNSITGLVGRCDPTSESPRSLDHYYGFGTNYHQILGRVGANQAPSAPASVAATAFAVPPGQPSLQDKWLEEQRREACASHHQHQQREAMKLDLAPGLGSSQAAFGAANCQQIPIWQAQTTNNNNSTTSTGRNNNNNNNRPAFGNSMSQVFVPQTNNINNLCPQITTDFGQYQSGTSAPTFQSPTGQFLQQPLAPPPPIPLRSSAAPEHHRRAVKIDSAAPIVMNQSKLLAQSSPTPSASTGRSQGRATRRRAHELAEPTMTSTVVPQASDGDVLDEEADGEGDNWNAGVADGLACDDAIAQTGDPEADGIVRGAKETAQMALSMYQFIRGEGELNTTQDLFTQAELFAEEANELYKEVRCFSYKVPSGDLKRDLLTQLGSIPALVQQLQFVVKSPTVGNAATFAKVDAIIRETRSLMDAVNRVVNATMSCRQQYNMAAASRKRTRTLSPAYRSERGSLDFDGFSNRQSGGMGGRQMGGGAGMGSEPDI